MTRYCKYELYEIDFLNENYGKITAWEIGKCLNRTADGITAEASKLDLHSGLGKTHFQDRKHSKKTLRLMSKIKLGRKNPFWKKQHKNISKKRIGKASKQLWKIPEHRLKTIKAIEKVKNKKSYKLKMKLATKGKKNGMFGKHHSKKTKRKISEINKGRFEGSKNPNYQNGKSREPYPLKWSENFKQQIRKRDRICAICRKKDRSRQLCVHHIDKNKRNLNPMNLICLRLYHHMKIHKITRNLKDYFWARILGLI